MIQQFANCRAFRADTVMENNARNIGLNNRFKFNPFKFNPSTFRLYDATRSVHTNVLQTRSLYLVQNALIGIWGGIGKIR